MKHLRSLSIVGLGLIFVACGGGGGGGGTPVLQSLSINPSTITLSADEVVVLTCLGHYSNGSAQALTAEWTVSGQIDAPSLPGTTLIVTAYSEGTGKVFATTSGLNAAADITIQRSAPADPGTVYGSGSEGVWSYPAQGGDPTLVAAQPGLKMATGSAITPDGRTMYITRVITNEERGISKVDLETGEVTDVVTLMAPEFDRPGGLALDSQGRILTACYGNAKVLRIDPATAVVETLSAAAGGHLQFNVGPDDSIYISPLLASSVWLSRYNPIEDTFDAYAFVPSSVTGLNGFIVAAVAAINHRNELYMVDWNDTRAFRCIDVNGDGFCLGSSENKLYSTFMTIKHMVFGGGIARCGTVLVNVEPGSSDTTTAGLGVYWLVDKNLDDDAADVGEVVFLSEKYIHNGIDGGSLHGRR